LKKEEKQMERVDNIMNAAESNFATNSDLMMDRFKSATFESIRGGDGQLKTLTEFAEKTFDLHRQWLLMYPWRNHKIVVDILSDYRDDIPDKMKKEWDIRSKNQDRYGVVYEYVGEKLASIKAIQRSIATNHEYLFIAGGMSDTIQEYSPMFRNRDLYGRQETGYYYKYDNNPVSNAIYLFDDIMEIMHQRSILPKIDSSRRRICWGKESEERLPSDRALGGMLELASHLFDLNQDMTQHNTQ